MPSDHRPPYPGRRHDGRYLEPMRAAEMQEYYDKTLTAAERYDALHAEQEDDVRFYVEEALAAGGPVLEVGCGTGRVTLPIAAAGVRVVGLDRSAPMLRVAGDKLRSAEPATRGRCGFIRADMRAFGFRRPFAQAFLPFRVFQGLITIADQLAALAAIRAALAPGGRLVLNVFDPRLDILAGAEEEPDAVHDSGRSYRAGDGVVRERFTARYDLVAQILDLTFIYERVGEAGVVIERAFEPLRLRYFHRFELEHLLARAGFEVEALHGTFDRTPFSENGQEMIWIAHRSAGAA